MGAVSTPITRSDVHDEQLDCAVLNECISDMLCISGDELEIQLAVSE
jgi:hypothetical protein